MKPISLQMEAFGPYLDRTEINFEKLNEAGLFLITGSTGGGKTTILDAMCIALYNKSTGGRRSFSDMRNLSADTTQRTEVTFIFTLGDTQYRFHRALFMKKKRGSDVYELHDLHECARLKDAVWEPIASGSARAVTDYAQSLLSLTAEQFSQVIVLPQGEFLRLLRANSREKGEILKTLFACESWKTLVLKLGDRSKAISAKRQNCESMLQSLLEKHHATDDIALQAQIDTLTKEASTMQTDLHREQEKSRLLQAKLERCMAFAQIQKESSIASEQLSAAKKQLLNAKQSAEKAQEEYKKVDILENRLLTAERTAEALRQEQARSLEKQSLQKEIQRCELKISTLKADAQNAEEVQLAALKSIEIGEAYLAEITQAAEQIPVLLTQKAALENDLRLLSEHTKATEDLEACKKELRIRRDQALREKLTVSAQDKAIAAAETVRLSNSAAALAAELKDGVACPVCGALQHPAPAFKTAETVSEAELNTMREQLDVLRQTHNRAENAAAAAQAHLDIATTTLDKLQKDCAHIVTSFETLQKNLNTISYQIALLEKKSAKIPAAQKKLKLLRDNADTAARKGADVSAQLAASLGELEQLRKHLQSFDTIRDADCIAKALADLQKDTQQIRTEKANLERAQHAAAEALAAATELHSTAEKRVLAAKEALTAFGEAPTDTVSACSEALEHTQAQIHTLSISLGSTQEALQSTKESHAIVQDFSAQAAQLDKEYSRITRLYGLLSGQKNSHRMPILQYVLSIMLDETIYNANQYFTIFSRGRYALNRMSVPKSGQGYTGLDIEVLDGSSGICRSFETLSGGEQFLASLSLAFGLSEVVQENSGVVRMDSIFIDEGFGSLDGDTLDTAMKALEEIRQSGRVVGIISHVSELRHRIPTMIQVSQKQNHSATAKVISE